ncbi:AEC family transporter [Streptomyces genisteinicus]|uniref:AEC family transporter n=1 Tax=Streptomyces genisteinicus TaxID=2768068 RepID=A0A7H0HMD3_9ACTN|nr:AEC family transporter [Streptomyces genisteinicus]QNP61699.1 AEC family transporter [Streptomyces genisteinicus]
MTVLAGFLPIWVITAAGWAAGRLDVLGGQAQFVLARFAFVFAMPALLFLTLSRAGLSRLATPGVAVFALSLVLMFALGLVLGRRVFRRGRADRAIGAMAGSYVNSANLGIPVALHVLGDASFVIAVALVQTLFVTPVIIVLIELDTGGPRHRPRRLLLLPLRNPVIAASAAGAAVAALGLRLPPEATAPVEMLGGAAVPAALFALGLSLDRRRPAGDTPRESPATVRTATGGPGPEKRSAPDGPRRYEKAERYVLVLLKTVVHPLLAWVLAHAVFRLDGDDLLAVVLCAGLPTAQNAFVYASEYRLDTRVVTDTVLLSTVLSTASLSVIAWLLA